MNPILDIHSLLPAAVPSNPSSDPIIIHFVWRRSDHSFALLPAAMNAPPPPCTIIRNRHSKAHYFPIHHSFGLLNTQRETRGPIKFNETGCGGVFLIGKFTIIFICPILLECAESAVKRATHTAVVIVETPLPPKHLVKQQSKGSQSAIAISSSRRGEISE